MLTALPRGSARRRIAGTGEVLRLPQVERDGTPGLRIVQQFAGGAHDLKSPRREPYEDEARAPRAFWKEGRPLRLPVPLLFGGIGDQGRGAEERDIGQARSIEVEERGPRILAKLRDLPR